MGEVDLGGLDRAGLDGGGLDKGEPDMGEVNWAILESTCENMRDGLARERGFDGNWVRLDNFSRLILSCATSSACSGGNRSSKRRVPENVPGGMLNPPQKSS